MTGTVATVIAGLSGCADQITSRDTSTSPASEFSEGSGTAGTELDLREANVVGVSVEGADSGYTFDVTLYHDDDGEEGYANWWQVERLNGTMIDRRDLSHSHGTRRFTRSKTIDIPTDASCVVVRGHDQTHAYGGLAMLVTVTTGETTAIEQGPERESMADRSC